MTMTCIFVSGAIAAFSTLFAIAATSGFSCLLIFYHLINNSGNNAAEHRNYNIVSHKASLYTDLHLGIGVLIFTNHQVN